MARTVIKARAGSSDTLYGPALLFARCQIFADNRMFLRLCLRGLMSFNQWMKERLRLARVMFVVLAALNGYSAYHILVRSRVLGVIQGIVGVLLLLVAIFIH